MVARIMLRNELGQEPTADEVKNRMKELRKKIIPPEVITTAFVEGKEVRQILSISPWAAHTLLPQKLYPWKLECQGYEESLQWEMAVAFPHHKAKPRKRRSDVRVSKIAYEEVS